MRVGLGTNDPRSAWGLCYQVSTPSTINKALNTTGTALRSFDCACERVRHLGFFCCLVHLPAQALTSQMHCHQRRRAGSINSHGRALQTESISETTGCKVQAMGSSPCMWGLVVFPGNSTWQDPYITPLLRSLSRLFGDELMHSINFSIYGSFSTS